MSYTNYNEFRKDNKEVNQNRLHILSVDFSKDLCIVGDYSKLMMFPIELLISHMENEYIHINDFCKLKEWNGFNDSEKLERMCEGFLPDDLAEYSSKYIRDVTECRGNYIEAYKTIGQEIADNYNDAIKRDWEIADDHEI